MAKSKSPSTAQWFHRRCLAKTASMVFYIRRKRPDWLPIYLREFHYRGGYENGKIYNDFDKWLFAHWFHYYKHVEPTMPKPYP